MSPRGSVDGHPDPQATPVADQPDDESEWTQSDVARRLGVAPATLRTWDRRFGLGPSGGTEAAPRYSDSDIARLEVMRRLTLDGVAPQDAARTAVTAGLDEDILADDLYSDAAAIDIDSQRPSAGRVAPGAAETQSDGFEPRGNDASTDGEESAEEPTTAQTIKSSRPLLRAIPGGDQGVSRTKPASQDVQNSTRVVAIIDAALGYDQPGCNQLLRLGPQESPVDWWTKVVEPAWARIAERTVLGTPGEAPEMVLASAALGALREFTREYELSQVAIGNPPVNHPSRMRKLVLIFAPIDEDIPLAAHALAAALVSQGATARVVTGPASPRRAVELVTMVRPAALVLATSLARPDLGIVAAVHEAFPDLPMLVSLQRDDALPDLPLAPSVQRVRSFAALVHEVLAIVE